MKTLLQVLESEVLDRQASSKEVELNKPGSFNVCILNDPVTPGMLVLEAIVHVIKISPAEAMRRVMTAHRGGWAVVATYSSKDVAETKASLLEDYVRNDKKYDDYHQYTGHAGAWPFTVEVMEAGG
jgi:ATP-dependent Clp protease adapter protein ClpS